MAGIDINRTTSGVDLPAQVSSEIWSTVQEESAVMRLAQQVSLPGSGITIPVVTGDAEADWVAETDEKPVSRATVSNKQMTPYKLAVIEPFSNEFRRDLPALYAELARRLPGAIARKFDSTVFGTTAPGSNFDTLGGSVAVGLAPHATNVKLGTYSGLVAADQAVAVGGGMLNGWALSPQARGLLLSQVDGSGRPLIVNSIQQDGAVPNLLSQPTYFTKAVHAAGTPNTIGFAGDWSSARFGTVEGIKVSASSEATITDGTTTLTVTGGDGGTVVIPRQLNLFQRNMFALLVEVEIGFVVRDGDHFVKLTDAVRS